jgi:hypothetical protein
MFNLVHPVSRQKIVPFYWPTLYILVFQELNTLTLLYLDFLKEQSFLSVCVLDPVFLLSNFLHI